ncbi:MAG: anion transporter [Gammaproteobacteria bacterium]|nr:anion transporter [Gammaproteobacteria bacterium]
MAGGALAVLASGDIAPSAALRAIDPDVMAFLFGMFVVGEALLASGYLYVVAWRVLRRARSTDALVLVLLFAFGAASALLMNDTLAVVGTPLVLLLARLHAIDRRVLLLALAFAVTIGSVMSPIGNPQNLLIAVRGGFETPFVTFAAALGVPTIVNLLLAYAVLRVVYRREFHRHTLVHEPVAIQDAALARVARIALGCVMALIAVKVALIGTPWEAQLRLSYIALAGALPVLLLSPRRRELVRALDWRTLVFFAAMFVLMAGVWESGAVAHGLPELVSLPPSMPLVLAAGLLASQIVSNVPLVALYLPLLVDAGADTHTLLGLAAGSTIAGNLLVLGAASNVIIIQRAERDGAGIGFLEFARAGVPLALLNVLVYWLWLR